MQTLDFTDRSSPDTMKIFKNQYKFLRLHLTMSTAILLGGCVFYIPTVILLPKLPMSFYSIHAGEDNFWLRVVLSIFEWYLYPVAWGILAIGNILICITYRVISNCIKSLTRSVKQNSKHQRVDWVNREYQTIFFIMKCLSSVFSFSLLCQEFAFLMVIAYLFVGASNLAEESGFLAAFFYVINMEYSYGLTMQFYPMIVLNLNSKEFIRTCRSYLSTDRYSRLITQRFKELKVRPMEVHSVTLGTLADYVVFVASFILMLFKR